MKAHLIHDGLGVMTSEGDLPSVQLPQQDGEAVHVTPGAGRTPPQELRSLKDWKILVLSSILRLRHLPT